MRREEEAVGTGAGAEAGEGEAGATAGVRVGARVDPEAGQEVGPPRKREKGATVGQGVGQTRRRRGRGAAAGQGVGRTQKRGLEVRQKVTERGQRVDPKRRGRDPEVDQRRGGQRVRRKTGMKSQGAALSLMKEERGLPLAAPEILTTNEKIVF